MQLNAMHAVNRPHPLPALTSHGQATGPAVTGSALPACPVTSLNANGFQESTVLLQTVQLLSVMLDLLTQLLPGAQSSPGGGKLPDGATGPYNADNPVGYGRNAFLAQSAVNGNAFTTPYRYAKNPADSAAMALSTLGFVNENLRSRDVDGNGKNSAQEMLRVLGNPEQTRLYMDVVDRNRDGEVDTVELAALSLAADANRDGVITPQETQSQSTELCGAPQAFAEKLDAIRQAHQLAERYWKHF
jgi:hypothetical protein